MSKYVVIVASFPDAVQKASALGVPVLNLVKLSEFDSDDAKLCEATFILDWSSEDTLKAFLQPLAHDGRISAITTFWEWALTPTADIAAALGLPGLDRAANAATRDKLRMRELLRQKKAPYSANYISVDGPEAFSAARDTLGYPFILKPTTGTATIDVAIIRSAADFAYQSDRLGDLLEKWGKLIAETLIIGDEYTVEGFSAGGDHKVLAITDKVMGGQNQLVEMCMSQPSRLSRRIQSAVIETVTQFLRDTGFSNGPSHTEVLVQPNGEIFVIEGHARPAGDFTHHLVELTTGFDMLTSSLLLGLGREINLNPSPRNDVFAATQFFHFGQGTVEEVQVLGSLEGLPGYVRHRIKIGKGYVSGPLRDSRDRHGYLLMTGRSHEEVAQRIGEALRMIEVRFR